MSLRYAIPSGALAVAVAGPPPAAVRAPLVSLCRVLASSSSAVVAAGPVLATRLRLRYDSPAMAE